MLNRELLNTDMLYQNNIVYLSNELHDYMLSNFFVAFVMGVLLGVIIGLNAYLITDCIKKACKIED